VPPFTGRCALKVRVGLAACVAFKVNAALPGEGTVPKLQGGRVVGCLALLRGGEVVMKGSTALTNEESITSRAALALGLS